MKNTEVDLFVVGAGSGGMAAAKRAASYGANVAIAENSRVGGTCVIRGCVPKKLMVYAAHLGEARHLAADFGWAAAPPEFSWARLCQVRDQVVNNLELAHQRYLAQAKVELVQDRARLLDAHTVEVGNRRFMAKHILIASGAHPVMPTVPGHEHCIDSDALFELKEMPKSALLVGGGYIAVEFAGMLRGLGCKVTLVVRSQVLRSFDSDIRATMVEAMRQRGIEVLEGTQIDRIEEEAAGTLAVHVHRGGESDVARAEACVLFATGRTPNTAGLGLEAVGVQLGPQGAVQVDEHHTTAVRSIHAIGDVLDRVNLTPVAIKAGRTWADRLFGGMHPPALSYENIPTAVFGLPPIGAVGLTEEEARTKLGDAGVRVYKSRYIPLLFSGTPQDRKGASMIKLVIDSHDDRILGCHMLGEDAPEIIQGFATAVVAGLTKAQLDATVAMHPTQAEEFVLMR